MTSEIQRKPDPVFLCEGSHVVDGKKYLATGQNVTSYNTEHRAYNVGALVSVGLTTESSAGIHLKGYSPESTVRGVTNPIWSGANFRNITGTTPQMVSQAKARIHAGVVSHLANIGIQPAIGAGSRPAFPGAAGIWR